jgi:hypothetical protein
MMKEWKEAWGNFLNPAQARIPPRGLRNLALFVLLQGRWERRDSTSSVRWDGENLRILPLVITFQPSVVLTVAGRCHQFATFWSVLQIWLPDLFFLQSLPMVCICKSSSCLNPLEAERPVLEKW